MSSVLQRPLSVSDIVSLDDELLDLFEELKDVNDLNGIVFLAGNFLSKVIPRTSTEELRRARDFLQAHLIDRLSDELAKRERRG